MPPDAPPPPRPFTPAASSIAAWSVRCTRSGASGLPQKSTVTDSVVCSSTLTLRGMARPNASTKAVRPSCADGGRPALERRARGAPSTVPSWAPSWAPFGASPVAMRPGAIAFALADESRRWAGGKACAPAPCSNSHCCTSSTISMISRSLSLMPSKSSRAELNLESSANVSTWLPSSLRLLPLPLSPTQSLAALPTTALWSVCFSVAVLAMAPAVLPVPVFACTRSRSIRCSSRGLISDDSLRHCRLSIGSPCLDARIGGDESAACSNSSEDGSRCASNAARRVSSSRASSRASKPAVTADSAVVGDAHASSSLASSVTTGAISRSCCNQTASYPGC